MSFAKSFANQINFKGRVTSGFKGVTVAQAMGCIQPAVDMLLAKSKTDGEKRSIIMALLYEADRISADVPITLADIIAEKKGKRP